MAFWHRISQSKLKQLSHCFKRSYLQVTSGSVPSVSASFAGPKGSYFNVFGWRGAGFCDNVRFYAAPVQAKPKEEKKEVDCHRLNEQITAREVRIVTDEGDHYIVSFREALEKARQLKLDLVEVQRSSDPPVCKIMDYHKENYKRELKGKDLAKAKAGATLRKSQCKEVRFTGKTELKDLSIKADGIKRLMDRGHRVKCMAMGTENQDLGGLLARMCELIEDVSVIESGPHVEKKSAYCIVRHVKYGPKKGGSKKKMEKEGMAAQPDGSEETEEYGSEETAEEVVSDEEDSDDAWSTAATNDDFSNAFNLRSDSDRVSNSNYMNERASPRAERPPSPFNFNPSHLQRPAQAPDPQMTENRYRRRDPNSGGRGMRDNFRYEPQNPNQRTQMPSDAYASGAAGESRYARTQPSFSKNFDIPPREMNRQPPPRPGGQNSPSPSYGNFSTPRNQGR